MSIASELAAFQKSDKFKRIQQETLADYRRRGITHTEAGYEVIPEDRAYKSAEKFIEVLRATARSYDLPASIMAHIDGMQPGELLHVGSGEYILPLSFAGDMSRESLENSAPQYDKYNGHTGEGIENIVALFNNGYEAHGDVYGYWRSHDTETYNLQARVGLHFIQQAIQDFNAQYGAKYNVTVEASDIYQ